MFTLNFPPPARHFMTRVQKPSLIPRKCFQTLITVIAASIETSAGCMTHYSLVHGVRLLLSNNPQSLGVCISDFPD